MSNPSSDLPGSSLLSREAAESLAATLITEMINRWRQGIGRRIVPLRTSRPLTKAVLVDQFTRLRDGDRYFYLNEQFTPDEQRILRGTTLSKIIEENTELTSLQQNVFFFKASNSGTVFNDLSRNGHRGSFRAGLSGVTVQLEDENGNVLATTTTNRQGQYRFDNFNGITGTGDYVIRVVLPSGFRQTTADPAAILISRGDINVRNVDFGLAPARTSSQQSSDADGASATDSDPAAIEALFSGFARRRR